MTLSSRLRRNWALVQRQLRPQQVDVRRRQRARLRRRAVRERASTSAPSGGRRVSIGGTSSTATRVLPAVRLRPLDRLPASCPACRSTPPSAATSTAASAAPDRPYSAPGVPFQRNGFRDEPFKEVNFRAQWGPRFNGDNRVVFTFDVFNVFNCGQHPAVGHRRSPTTAPARRRTTAASARRRTRTSCR